MLNIRYGTKGQLFVVKLHIQYLSIAKNEAASNKNNVNSRRVSVLIIQQFTQLLNISYKTTIHLESMI